MIAIIDYGAGNLRSVEKALEFLGFKAKITSKPDEIISADKVILPGVGAFGDCMNSINKAYLTQCIHQVIENNVPFLGICLGLQLLFETSEESPNEPGLKIFDGNCIKISKQGSLKIPHIGWNSIKYDKNCPIFQGLSEEPYVYFVHSYYINPKDKEIISAVTEYGTELPIAVHKNNIFATQFHPEKSGNEGLKVLKNFGNL